MTFKLLFQLIFGVFSLNPKNMRWFNLRRILICLLLFPCFIFILIFNRVFLLLDYVFFPKFLKQEVKEPVFIIAAPRSATTYLFHELAAHENYTCFKLWEIVFAPSICQKHIINSILKCDRSIGAPFRKIVLHIENIFVGNLKKIHLIGWNLPEEDETILLWDLSTSYLNFFYPDSTYFDDLMLFDDAVQPKRKARIMRSYAKYIKRHNYVFNRQAEKKYLSKNPIMMTKVDALSKVFPDAKILNINRCPKKTIPSTQELNRNLYKIFTSKETPKEIDKKTIIFLIQWYKMAEENLLKQFPNQHLKIDFIKLVTQDEQEIKRIAHFLDISTSGILVKRKESSKLHKSSNKYQQLNEDQINKILSETPFMSPYCE